MSLESGTRSLDRGRVRLGMIVAATMSLVLLGTSVALSFSAVAASLEPTTPAPSPAVTGPTLEGTQWVLAPSGTESLAGSATLTLQDGTATGNDGCTDYFAPYTLSGSALSFGPIGVTYPPVTCAETPAKFEAAYFGLLASVSRGA